MRIRYRYPLNTILSGLRFLSSVYKWALASVKQILYLIVQFFIIKIEVEQRKKFRI